jgi:uncharacterized protein RhaS with RHS repeats
VGRYVESDPIGLDGGANTYTYGYDMPTDQIDPLGLSSLVANLVNDTLTLIDKDGNIVATYPAGNNTINPTGDPNKVGCNCPAPTGTFPVQKPINTAGHHGGRRGPQSKTQGCIRVSDDTVISLYQFYQSDPITDITIIR